MAIVLGDACRIVLRCAAAAEVSGLDPSARYRLRVVYAGDPFSPATHLRLVANGKHEISPFTEAESGRAVEFDIPAAATPGGSLTLDFTQEPGRGGAGRGCQMAEVWLIAGVVMDSAWESPVSGAAAPRRGRVRRHHHDHEPRPRGARGTRRLRLPVDRDGAFADHAGDAAQHRAGDARTAGGAVRARAGERAVDGEAGARSGRARRDLSVTSNVERARQAVAACRYPPAGRRGSGAAGDVLLARSRRGLLRFGRSERDRGRGRRRSGRARAGRSRSPPRPASTSSSSAPAICRFRSVTAAARTTRASKRPRSRCSPRRAGMGRSPDGPRGRPN